MTAPHPHGRLLLRLILVVIGLAAPGVAPLAPGSPAAETASTMPARLAAVAPAVRAAEPESPDTAYSATIPPAAQILRPDSAARSLTALASLAPASLPGLPPRARGPPLG